MVVVCVEVVDVGAVDRDFEIVNIGEMVGVEKAEVVVEAVDVLSTDVGGIDGSDGTFGDFVRVKLCVVVNVEEAVVEL